MFLGFLGFFDWSFITMHIYMMFPCSSCLDGCLCICIFTCHIHATRQKSFVLCHWHTGNICIWWTLVMRTRMVIVYIYLCMFTFMQAEIFENYCRYDPCIRVDHRSRRNKCVGSINCFVGLVPRYIIIILK